MTLQAITFPEQESPDSAELTAYKKRVEEVAKRYAKRYNWCSTIDSALAEIDIIRSASDVVVNVATTQGYHLKVEVARSRLMGKEAEDQAEVLAGKIGTLQVTTPDKQVVTSFRIAAADITEMSLDPTASEEGGWVWRYVSDSARVMHRFNVGYARQSGYDGVYSACDRAYQYIGSLQVTSARGNGNQCQRCTARS